MVKVKLQSLSLYIFGLLINLMILEISPLSVWAQSTSQSSATEQAAKPDSAALEPEILSEINRVRTNPQGYAQWLEQQRQYYDGIWLRLPGEKPIRTNKGLKALEEAIATLREQQPLSALDVSEGTSANATSKLDNFATANNIQNISYGRVTPKGIVMSLVVDESFPDRRRRQSLLSNDAQDTGVVCKPDPRYAKVCAIAYSNTPEDEQVKIASTTEVTTTDNLENETKTESATDGVPKTTNVPENQTVANNSANEADTKIAVNNPEINNVEDNTIVEESLPEPPQPQSVPTKSPVAISTPQNTAEEAKTEAETKETEPEESVNNENENLEAEAEAQAAAEAEAQAAAEAEAQAAAEAEAQAAAEDTDIEIIATNSDSDRILESIEKGALEDGDSTIPDDGSFYDSYPIQGKSGDSFTIYLESDEFDPFVALIDDKGNIIEQNDDISEEDNNSQIKITIPEDGSYNVIVNAYDEGGRGEYILTVGQ